MCRRVDESREMSFSVMLCCFSHQIIHRNYFHMPLTLLCGFCKQGVSSYEKVRLHKWPDNALHPVDDGVVSYIRRDTSVTNEPF